jgi:hypothetical protein
MLQTTTMCFIENDASTTNYSSMQRSQKLHAFVQHMAALRQIVQQARHCNL